MPSGDPAARLIVRRKFERHPISGVDTKPAGADIARDAAQNVPSVRELDRKQRVGEGLENAALCSHGLFAAFRLACHGEVILSGYAGMVTEDAVAPYLTRSWMGHRWSAWMPLMAAHPLALAQLPAAPGLYRIRRSDAPDRLEWIAWEGRGVRETIERLSRQVHLPVEPYDDPSSPARALWELRRSAGVAFDVSGAAGGASAEEGLRLADELRLAYEAQQRLWVECQELGGEG
jgi:hypothetical protein